MISERWDFVAKSHNSLLFDRIPVWMVAIAVCGIVVSWAFFMERRILLDDYGLFNPIYTYVVNGVVSYPSYFQFDFMTVHPPTNYALKGFLISLGIPIPYALSLLPFILFLTIVFLILKSKFSTPTKMGLLFGTVAGSMIPWGTFSTGFGFGATRPDLEFAFALFGGLVALESGRISNWDLKRLAIGAFLLAYASGIHYPAMLSWIGILVYLGFALKINRMDWRKIHLRNESHGARVTIVMLLGALVFAIPFLLLWVIPTFENIVDWLIIQGNKSIRTPIDAILTHIQITRALFDWVSYHGNTIGSIIFFPLMTGIPVVLISTVILILRKETRLMALAALPTLLFGLLVIDRIQNGWQYYYLEFMLYSSAITIFGIAAIGFVVAKANRFRPKWNALVKPLIAIGLIVFLIFGTGVQNAEFTTHPRPDELPIARAAGKSILGENAFVGAELARSYIYGESHWVMLNKYIIWPSHIDFDIPSFFSKFDAIGVDNFNSNKNFSPVNNKTMISYYIDHTLDLHGFYFSSRHTSLSYVLLSTDRPTPLQGYGLLKDWTVIHFEENDSGNYVFGAAICNENDFPPFVTINPPTGDSLNTAGTSLFSNTYLLPKSSDLQEKLIVFVSTDSQYSSHRQIIASKCTIHDEIRLTAQVVDYNDLLRVLDNESPIQFHSNIESALEAKQLYHAAKP